MNTPSFPGTYDPPVDGARLAGRRLVEHPVLAARAEDPRPSVPDVLADAGPLLSTQGVTFEILRTRPGLVVLRARSDGRVTPQVACETVKGLLGGVTEDVCAVQASFLESTCAQHGAPACVYSVMWEEPASPRPLPPPPETLFDAPSDPVVASWDAAARIDSSSGEVAAPIGRAEAPLPEWDRPVPSEASATPSTEAPPWQRAPDAVPQPTATVTPPGPTPVPTAASSVGYHYQVSTAGAPIGSAAARAPHTRRAPPPGSSAPVVPGTAHRRKLAQGLLRRAWLLALAVVAGAAGGWFAGVHAGTSYGAQANLLVQSGAGKSGPGSANDALALATTYSAVIPKDQAILSTAASALGTTPDEVQKALSVTVETNTSILLLSFTAATPARAVAGADAVARAVASSTQLTPAIAPGSVAIVSLPTSAHRQGTLHKYGIGLGAFLGLVVGLILVLAAERSDPRIDDALTMATAARCRAALVPNDLSLPELARVLSDTGREEGPLTVVPIAVSDTSPTMELAQGLRQCWPADGPAVAISPAFSSGVVELSRGSGPTVLVSHPGARQRDVHAAAERLRMIGRPPVWAVLAHRRLRGRGPGRVG